MSTLPFGNIKALFYIPILTLCCGLVHAQVSQQTRIPVRIMPNSSSPVLPAGALSDEGARQTFEAFLAASGGRNTWRALKTAEATYDLPGRGGTNVSFVVLDDWTNEQAHYRRGAVGSTRMPRDHESGKDHVVTIGKFTRTVPELDEARVVADHFPSAAAELLLRSREYVLKLAPATQSDFVTVDVYRRRAKDEPALLVKDQEWRFTKATGLADSVKLELPDVLRGSRSIWEATRFEAYQHYSGVQVPTKLYAANPAGLIQLRTLRAFTPAVSYDKDAFDKEIKR